MTLARVCTGRGLSDTDTVRERQTEAVLHGTTSPRTSQELSCRVHETRRTVMESAPDRGPLSELQVPIHKFPSLLSSSDEMLQISSWFVC